MTTIKDYLDYAELAQASYGDLVAGMFGKANTQYFDELTRTDIYGEIKFSQTQATNFANRYRIIATTDTYGIGSSSGLDAALFYDEVGKKYVMSIRGTEFTSLDDIWSDILLVRDGVAYNQTNDLNLFYETLITNNVISSADNLDMTGHSLGGVLAQVFAATYPNVVNNAYTYNAPGIGGLGYQAYENLGINPATFSYTNITNIYAQEGSEVTSGLGA